MRFLQVVTEASLVFCGALTGRLIPIEKSASGGKPTPLILEANDGERREFRTRPGVTFTVKVDPENGGSEEMTVVTEDMAPGDKIPMHRHSHADELIFIESGTGKVTLGGKVRFAHAAGAIVFIPRDTWPRDGKRRKWPLKKYCYMVSLRSATVQAVYLSSSGTAHHSAVQSRGGGTS